ncbi:RING finger protein 32 [Trypanosoma rangeli]|uniref:RING finger protein 32 n=1 Tax=Trypanosoma rangeli TaxID=5698 RepID=A0A3S5IR12_TRYRA|nr:RING finger protein 32 [Trypanosoma rangeli]RNF03685.1 RING finger protein 32 [Trypanosoma rangeli]|eukprot:RNF03685.1 RING finger protein 32 [Trypanosoma rangeli]
MPAGSSRLPSISVKPRMGKRKEKVQIWSAVALQQHFSRGAMLNSVLPTLEEVPPPLPGGRQTLAQKMGLVPLPPPAPTEEEWTTIEGTALRRNAAMPLGANACCICQEPFYATMEQGQVLLRCSHVFHEQCFRRFEKLARMSRGKWDAMPLCCPVCRSSHYHKRIFYAGKAMAQRAAIVKIQAFFRRVLARKAYVKLRLESDSKFSGEYARERLARLSDAYAAYAESRERERANMLDNIELRLQRALAQYTTREEWNELRERAEAGGVLDCPICFGVIERNPHAHDVQKDVTGEDVVAAFRKEYDARMAQRRASESRKKGPPQLTGKRSSCVTIKAPPMSTQAHPTRSVARRSRQANPLSTVGNTCEGCGQSPVKVPEGSRYGLLLSCGHCFHDTCLSVFERYTEMRAVEHSDAALIPRCPLCRSAYVKMDY